MQDRSRGLRCLGEARVGGVDHLSRPPLVVAILPRLCARLIRERDAARDAGDNLARAVLRYLRGNPVDLRGALNDYGNNNGPVWAKDTPP